MALGGVDEWVSAALELCNLFGFIRISRTANKAIAAAKNKVILEDLINSMSTDDQSALNIITSKGKITTPFPTAFTKSSLD